MPGNHAAALTAFTVLLTLALAALMIAWARGRRWGDLSSRRHYGEALDEEELAALKRSRRSFWIWAGASLALTALAFLVLG